MPGTTSNSLSRKIAVLVDGDNAQPTLLEKILAEASKYGVVTIRRIYGDWTTSNMGGWKDILHTHAIQPIQQFRYTKGKNATDSAMIIDAMDIVYTGSVEGFCFVSSDSDYTRLGTRIREKGFFVMGVGRKSTPRAFVNACEVFVYTENLAADRDSAVRRGSKQPGSATAEDVPDPLDLLKEAFDMVVDEDGWAPLNMMGQQLRQLDPGFDPRTYGHKQLSLLLKAHRTTFTVKKHRNELQVKLAGKK
jgi:uncharacterized LabA/DUF88 family protein